MQECETPDVSPSADNTPSPVSLDVLMVLIARRLSLAVEVAAAKFVSGQQIDDPIREEAILDWVASSSIRGVGPEARAAFFRDQITANKTIQHGLHAYWREHAMDLPVSCQGSTEGLRRKLDTVNRHMLLLLPHIPHLSQEQMSALDDLLDRRLGSQEQLQQIAGARRTAGRIALRSLGEQEGP
jgi:chorismate mutase-like protein